jgi:hypothetical protein
MGFAHPNGFRLTKAAAPLEVQAEVGTVSTGMPKTNHPST